MRPLGITEHAFLKLINQYDIGAGFTDLAVTFGDKPHSADAGHGDMTMKQRRDGSYGKVVALRRGVVLMGQICNTCSPSLKIIEQPAAPFLGQCVKLPSSTATTLPAPAISGFSSMPTPTQRHRDALRRRFPDAVPGNVPERIGSGYIYQSYPHTFITGVGTFDTSGMKSRSWYVNGDAPWNLHAKPT